MWNITSNNVQRAKQELERRRTELETRHAEEKQALDTEFAVVETLERAAAEFMLRHARRNSVFAAEPPIESPGAGNESDDADNAEDGMQAARPIRSAERGEADDRPEPIALHPSAAIGSAETGELAAGLDILKPGSRWRLYRSSNRPTDPERIASDISLSTG
jgi:hypothetical protein